MADEVGGNQETVDQVRNLMRGVPEDDLATLRAATAAVIQAVSDAAKPDVVTAAMETVPDSAKVGVATAAVGAVPDSAKSAVAATALENLSEGQREALLPTQRVTDQVWLIVVGTFALVLVFSILALIWAAYRGLASTQLFLTVGALAGGVLAGFVGGRSAAPGATRPGRPTVEFVAEESQEIGPEVKERADSTAMANNGTLTGTKDANMADQIRRHVLQLEVMLLLVMFFLAVLAVLPVLNEALGLQLNLWVAFAFLAIVPLFIRVRNPRYTLRDTLTGTLGGIGAGGAIGGALAGALAGGIGGPVGSLIGLGIGAGVGAATFAPVVNRTPKNLTVGEARNYLFNRREKQYPHISRETIIKVTNKDNRQKSWSIFMFRGDDGWECRKNDVDEWLESEKWKQVPP